MLSRRLEYRITGRDESRSAFRSAQQNIRKTEERISGLATSAFKVQRAFGILTLGVGAGSSVRELNVLEQQLIRLRGVSSDFAGDQQFLSKTSRELGLNLKNLTSSFVDVQTLEAIELIKPGQARDLAVGFEQAAARFGTSSEDIKLAVRGLRQSLTQEIVRAQEFDQIFDAIGAAQPLVAKNLGLTTKEFQKMRTANSLLATDLVDALVPALLSLDGAAQARAESIQGSFNKIATSYQTALLAFNEPVRELFAGAADGLEETFLVIGNNAELIAASIETIAVASVAAFGGVALRGLVSYGQEQIRSISISRAHSAAILENAQRKRASVAADLAAARSSASYTASLVAQNKGQLLLAGNLQTRVRLMGQLGGLQRQAAASASALAVATESHRLSVIGVNSAQRAAALSTGVFSAASRGLSAALSLVGGPAGAAAIAITLAGSAALSSSAAYRQLSDTVSDLRNAESKEQIKQADLDATRVAAQEKIVDLQLRINSITRGNADLRDRILTSVTSEEAVLGLLNRTLANTRAELQSTFDIYDDLPDLNPFNQSVQDQIDAIGQFGDAIDGLGATSESAEGLLDKIFPSRAKIADLVETRTELERLKGSISPTEYSQANAAITEQINKLNGVTEARKRAAKAQEDALKQLESLEKSLATERQRLQKEFDDTEKNVLKLQVELGTDRLSDNDISLLVSRAREKLDVKLEELHEKEVKDEQRRADEISRIRGDKLRERLDLEAALREQNTPVDQLDSVDAINRRFRIEENALREGFDFKNGLDAEYVNSSISLESERQAALTNLTRRGEEERQAERDRFVQGVDAITGLSGSVLALFEKDVGSYIKIQEKWTDAEKARARRSNEINRKAFEQNKRARRAQAVIDGFGAVAKAFGSLPPPFSYIAAATAAASAAKIVSDINSSSFGGGGSVAFGGSGSSSSASTSGSSTNNEIANQNANGGPTKIILINQIPPNLQGAIDPDWMYRNNIASLKKMVEDDVIPEDFVINDVGGSQDLREIG